ncbi:MAG TPA: hypothetical protein VGR35_01290 [Tepidisphaeraceae bacterium]|nr:hypothetical protein [Tepidisphaeraceae bacterium]
MDSRKFNPADLAKLMRKANDIAAYFRRLSGRCHQRHLLTTDPLRIAADQMEQAAEKYRAAVWQLGEEAGVTDQYGSDGESGLSSR